MKKKTKRFILEFSYKLDFFLIGFYGKGVF